MKRIALLPALAIPMLLNAAGSSSILARMDKNYCEMREFIGATWQNPALKYFSRDIPFSTLSIGYDRRSDSESVYPKLGYGSYACRFNAESFITAGDNSAVWGNAGYATGKTLGIQWCETSDPQLLYPYFTADETGGDMSDEYYSFAGGYARSGKKFTWGATLGYAAAHHFRNVDPRPRNITGELTLSAGISHSLTANYMAGVSLEWMKYKQSNEIKFVSETHDLPLYQLSGLGTNYNRFAGSSKAADFSGNRLGATLNLFPRQSGWLINLSLYRFTFGKTLRDLNKLPLVSVWHNSLSAEAGYKFITDNRSFAVTADFDAGRRHGTENIFGDAASGSYPRIGSLEMYADNRYGCKLRGFASLRHNRLTYSLTVSGGYSHRKEFYAEPVRCSVIEGIEAEAHMRIRSFLGKRWYGIADASCSFFSPTASELSLTPVSSVPESLTHSLEQAFHCQSVTRCATGFSLTAARSISEKYALGITLAGSLANYSGAAHSHSYNLNINFYF